MKPTIKIVWRKHLLKILALFFSFLLWFYVLNSESEIKDISMDIEFNLPKHKAISELIIHRVKVKLKGPRAFFRNFEEESNKVFIDIKKIGKHKNRFVYNIDNENIPVPFGMEILDISPRSLKIKLESKISKNVNIKANIVGELPKNFKLHKYELKPAKILIEGPKTLIKSINEVRTKPIDIGMLEGEDLLKVGIEDLDRRIQSNLNDESVDFNYNIRPRKANITLKNIEILFLSRGQNFKSKVKMVAIDVLVPGEGNVKIKKSEVKVVAEIPKKLSKSQRVKLKATLPKGVHLLQIHPEYITVSPKSTRKRKRKRRK